MNITFRRDLSTGRPRVNKAGSNLDRTQRSMNEYYYVPQKKTDSMLDMNTIPAISICCMTYNHVNFIEYAINGFLRQESNFPFEIIIYDDASTDGTTEIIKKYVKSILN